MNAVDEIINVEVVDGFGGFTEIDLDVRFRPLAGSE